MMIGCVYDAKRPLPTKSCVICSLLQSYGYIFPIQLFTEVFRYRQLLRPLLYIQQERSGETSLSSLCLLFSDSCNYPRAFGRGVGICSLGLPKLLFWYDRVMSNGLSKCTYEWHIRISMALFCDYIINHFNAIGWHNWGS